SRPVPVVVCSITHESGASALEALELGAVEFVQKPTALATDRIFEIADELLGKVNAASSATHLQPTHAAVSPPEPAPPPVAMATRRADIVLIGISTGGPQALRYLVPR